jgi:hypothetical protein
MTSELASGRQFGLIFGLVLVSVLVLNALSY